MKSVLWERSEEEAGCTLTSSEDLTKMNWPTGLLHLHCQESFSLCFSACGMSSWLLGYGWGVNWGSGWGLNCLLKTKQFCILSVLNFAVCFPSCPLSVYGLHVSLLPCKQPWKQAAWTNYIQSERPTQKLLQQLAGWSHTMESGLW